MLIFLTFNFVNKKLKKVNLPLFSLRKFIYLCSMNYSQGQYRTSSQLSELCRGISQFVKPTECSVVCCQCEIVVYNANTEAIAGMKCENV